MGTFGYFRVLLGTYGTNEVAIQFYLNLQCRYPKYCGCVIILSFVHSDVNNVIILAILGSSFYRRRRRHHHHRKYQLGHRLTQTRVIAVVFDVAFSVNVVV